jgi:pilus assembly protein FimV
MDMGSPLDFPEQALETQSLETQSSEVPTLDSKAAESSVQMEVAEFGKTLSSIEMAGLDMPEIGAEVLAPAMEMPQEVEPVAVPKEVKPEEGGGLDFNFDMGATETAEDALVMQASEADLSQPETKEATEIDLSGISLDLDAKPAATEQAAAAVNSAEAASAGDEPEDVNTKLDLVTAYIDMGDKEGARELLEEVLKEGGAQQRERAQQMLSSLA